MNHVKTKIDEINKIEGDSKTLKNELEVIDRTLHNLAQGYSKKNQNSIFKDIIQIEVDLPPSHPLFDKFIFDKVSPGL